MTYSKWIRVSRRAASLILAGLFAAGLTACDDGPTGSETTSLTVQLTDHPSGDVKAAWLQVDSVEFQGTGGGVVVMDQPSDYIRVSDLQAEEDEFEALVEGVEVSSGTYGQVRVFIGGAAIQSTSDDVFTLGDDVPSSVTSLDADGTTDDLLCPSCSQTGIKAFLPEQAVQLEGGQKVLAIDFDVSQSFGIQAGMSGMWVMHPVMEILDLETTGRTEGSIVDDEDPTVSFPDCGGDATTVEQFEPLAISTVAPEDTATGTVDPDSSYAILMAAGTYDMSFEDKVAFANEDTLIFAATPSAQGPVDLAEGAVETVDYELDEVSCKSAS